jgi:hypothetical protein
LLAVTIAVLAVAGTAYLGSHKLSNPDHYWHGFCPDEAFVYHAYPPPCRPPARAAWQIPLAVVIATLGLGGALALAGGRPAPRARDGARRPDAVA